MAESKYCGWKNRATWAAWLEINNDYRLYQLMREYCKLCIKLGQSPNYKRFINVCGMQEAETSSGTKFISAQLSYRELNAALSEEVTEIKRFG